MIASEMTALTLLNAFSCSMSQTNLASFRVSRVIGSQNCRSLFDVVLNEVNSSQESANLFHAFGCLDSHDGIDLQGMGFVSSSIK